MLPEHRGSMSVTSHSITASSPSRVDMQVVWYGAGSVVWYMYICMWAIYYVRV